LKTGIRFFTPILQPAMDVLKKYNFELPKISNQKGNDYLHVIQSMMGLNKSLTFHVARHSFATLALSHGVPLEDVARMLGHEDVHTTLIYAKILKNTIQQFSTVLQKSIQ
jgi:integrase/recombinase XerD